MNPHRFHLSPTRLLKAVRSGNKGDLIDAIPEHGSIKPDSATDPTINDISMSGSQSSIRGPGLHRSGAKRFTYIVDTTPLEYSSEITSSTSSSDSSSEDDLPTARHPLRSKRTSFMSTSNRSIFIESKVKEQHMLAQKLQQMHLQVDRATQNATAGGHTAELRKAEEYIALISNLEDINEQNQRNILQLQQQLEEDESRMQDIQSNYNHRLELLQAQKENKSVEVLEWRKKHEVMKRLNYSLLEKMALKVIKQLDDVEEESKAKASEEQNRYDEMGRFYDELLEKVGEMADENGKLVLKCVQLSQETTKQAKLEADLKQMQSDNETVKSQVDDWKEKHQTMVQINEEIVGKMCQLSEENDELQFKCQELEFGKAESEATTAVQHITSMRAIITDEGSTEDAAEQATSTGQDTPSEIEKLFLHQSMESALELASAMNDKMTSLVVAHNISVQGYEEKIASLKSELKETASSKEESSIGSRILREEVETLHENLRQCERVVLGLEAERNDAYDTCEILQQEIDFQSQKFASSEYQRSSSVNAEFTT